MRISDILENHDTTHPITNADLNDLFGDHTIDDGNIMVRNNMVGYILDDGGVVDMRGDMDKHIGWMVENASAGATSAGGIATSVGGFGSTQKRDYSASIYPTNETDPITTQNIKTIKKQDLIVQFGSTYKITSDNLGHVITVNNKVVGYITPRGDVSDTRGDVDKFIGILKYSDLSIGNVENK